MNSSTELGLVEFRLDGKIAVVTGGAAGIGLAAATMMSEAGAQVVLLDRDVKAAAAALQRLSGAHFLPMDAASDTSISEAFAAVARQYGQVDVLVNNVGVSIRKSADEISLAEWNHVLNLNVTGCFRSAVAARRLMPMAGGSIVNTASVMGLSGGGPYPNPSYHATKGAVVNLTRSLAIEWAPHNIRVNAVAPTWTDTGFIGGLSSKALAKAEAATPLGRIAKAREVAAAIQFLASPAAAMITGQILAVDGGFLAQ